METLGIFAYFPLLVLIKTGSRLASQPQTKICNRPRSCSFAEIIEPGAVLLSPGTYDFKSQRLKKQQKKRLSTTTWKLWKKENKNENLCFLSLKDRSGRCKLCDLNVACNKLPWCSLSCFAGAVGSLGEGMDDGTYGVLGWNLPPGAEKEMEEWATSWRLALRFHKSLWPNLQSLLW